MGLYRTLSEAQAAPGPFVSWKTKVISKVTLKDGTEYFRTHEFDLSRHKCKRCRKARSHGKRHRLACTGHSCERCGNPFAAFTRKGVRKMGHQFVQHEGWTDIGRLH